MDNNARLVAGIIFFCVALTGMILANLFTVMMIGEINRKRADANQISYFGYTFGKIRRIFREYHASYPDGRLNIYTHLAFGVAAICLISMAICFRIIG
jgi:hypothetical protein